MSESTSASFTGAIDLGVLEHKIANDDRVRCRKHSLLSGVLRSTTSEMSVRRQPGGRLASAGGKCGGNSLIEFTLTVPLLLLVMTGMVSFGFALNNYLQLTNAVNIGAQVVSFSRGQTSDPCATGQTAITNAAPFLTPSKLSLTFVINGTTYSNTTSCPAGAANMVQGSTLQVTGTYPYLLYVVGFGNGTHTLETQVSEFIQ